MDEESRAAIHVDTGTTSNQHALGGGAHMLINILMILNRDETVVSEVTVLTGSGGVQRPAHGVPRKGKVK
jgi:hypothetical protein